MKALNVRMADGDAEAFAAWYDAIAGSVYHYLLTQVGTYDDAADLLQNTFLRLYRHRAKLCDVENLRAYTFQAARNEWLRWLGNRRRDLPLIRMETWFEPTTDEIHGCSFAAEEIQLALQQLETKYREVIELKIFSQLTFEEIAVVLEKPTGTIATWYRRAIERMRKRLRERTGD